MLLFVGGRSADLLGEPIEERGTVIHAFGGLISVPGYMEIIIQPAPKGHIEIRILKKMDSEGELESIIIQRPPKREEMSSNNLALVNEYEVNGFSVELYEPNHSKWGFNLLAARVERCDEVGQIIVKRQLFLDRYLAAASAEECE